MRLIDADEYEKRIKPYDTEDVIDKALYNFAHEKLITTPTAQPERKKGKWIDYSDEGYVECPFCHSATNCEGNKDELHYCFSCGADMRGEENGKNK